MKQLKLGSKWVDDVANPKASEIDDVYMNERLRRNHRFSDNPKALSIYHHSHLVHDLAKAGGEVGDVLDWAKMHDCHEYVTGDIPTPIKRLMGDRIGMIERAWDRALCESAGVKYPTESTREIVKKYDKISAIIEWYYILGEEYHPDFEHVPLCDVPQWVLRYHKQ